MYRDMSGSLRNRTYNPFTHTHAHKQSSIHICKNIHTYTHMRTIYTYTNKYICTYSAHSNTMNTYWPTRLQKNVVRYASTLVEQVKIQFFHSSVHPFVHFIPNQMWNLVMFEYRDQLILTCSLRDRICLKDVVDYDRHKTNAGIFEWIEITTIQQSFIRLCWCHQEWENVIFSSNLQLSC